MMTVKAVLKAYDRGVMFRCGCFKQGLHERVEKALQEGSLPLAQVMICPLHAQPIEQPVPQATS